MFQRLCRLLTPKRSTKGEFFMKRRLSLTSCFYLFIFKSGSNRAVLELSLIFIFFFVFIFYFAHSKRGCEGEGVEIERGESGDSGRGQGAEKQLGCQIKWECNGERLVLPLQRWGESWASSASNFHTSISAQLRSALRNQSSRKYPWGTAE